MSRKEVTNYSWLFFTALLDKFFTVFLSAFDRLIDYALDNQVDLVVFCGDAYKTREPSLTQQREFARRIKRLSAGGIPAFLLIGNHDLPNAIGRATTIEIFDTLSIENIYVANKPGIFNIPTRHGIVQVAALPWLRRSALLSKEDTKNLDFHEINQKLQQVLTSIIAQQANDIDPSLPSILAAHIWVLNARVGSEKTMTIGQEHMLLLSNVARPEFDYVALGHIHKQQVLLENPPVVYSGSLERLDFGEEEDQKGFYVIDIEPGTVKRQVRYNFYALSGRRFLSINVDIDSQESDPNQKVFDAISERMSEIKDAIVRINIGIPANLVSRIKENEIKSVIKDAYYAIVAKDIKRESRLKLGGRGPAQGITPYDALKTYLETKHNPERARILMEYGEKLIQERSKK